jgi:3-hydroxy-9,10-secoandrosta-1,3,5(10)-triene-9,17-dione monooxygenase
METASLATQTRSPGVATALAQAPEHDELVARAAALRDQLAQDAPEADRTRRLTDRSIDGIKDAGLTRLMTPRCLGGYESDVRTVLDVVTELGRGCGSSAWVTAVLNSGNFMAGLFPDRAREDVWGDDPAASTALVLVGTTASAEPADGGLMVTGKWGYASGSLHCEWVALLVPVDRGQERPEINLVLVPMRDLRVEDTWFIVGMRGTGSNTVVADKVFVPQYRVMPFMAAVNGERLAPHADEPLYRSSVSGVLQVFLLGSLIGGAQTALSYVLGKAPKRAIASSTYTSQAQSAAFQIDVAEASGMTDTAYLHARRIAETVDRSARLGEPLDIPTRARMRMDAAQAARTCREAVDLLMTAHGTSAFAEASPLQLIWRNVSVGSRHAGFGSRIPQEVYGRALLDLDPRQVSYLL